MAKIDTREYGDAITELTDSLSNKHPSLSIRVISNLEKEDSGVASYRITIAPLDEKGTMILLPKSIGVFYIRCKGTPNVTTMIVAGSSMAPLFTNSDEDSMNTGMVYLTRILGRECEHLLKASEEHVSNTGRRPRAAKG